MIHFKKLFYFLSLTMVFTYCSSTPEKEVDVDPDSIFASCMETFKDESQCNKMKLKAIENQKLKEEEKAKENRKVELTEEEEKNIWIREDLKNALMMKNSSYVKNLIGEPDRVIKQSNGHVRYTYYRPICRYSSAHDPDKDLSIIFVKFKVSKVLHTPPDTTPDRSWIFEKKIERK